MTKNTKGWVAGASSGIAAALYVRIESGLDFNLPPDIDAAIIAALVAGITGFLTWLVPNEPKG